MRSTILCLGATPAAQRVMVFPRLTLDSVNRAAHTIDGEAGKAVNVAKVLKQLGEQPVLLGFFGGDRGKQILAALTANQIEVAPVLTDANTRQCITVIDQADQQVTELVEESKAVSNDAYDALLECLRHRLPTAKALIMSGTLTPGGPEDFYARCIQAARQHSALTILDAKGAPLEQALAAMPDLVKPNRSELAATCKRELPDEAAVLTAMRDLHALGVPRVVVTAGSEPTLALEGEACWRILAPNINALNPIGSGDSFTAGLAICLLQGNNLGEACRRGAAAGAANALTWMAGEINPSTYEELYAKTKVERVLL